MKKSVKDTIYNYANNNESSASQDEFYEWLLNPQEGREKLSAMRSLWNDTRTNTDCDTHIALKNFLKKVEVESDNNISPQSNFTTQRLSTVKLILAGIAAVFFVGLVSSYFTKQYFSATIPPIDIIEVVASRGKIENITLPDGTKVVLNSGSSLLYPNLFVGDNRTVHLVGEGFFEVTNNESKPFFVKSNIQEIKVIGTKFNISAYPEEGQIKATLIDGCVEGRYSFDDEVYTLSPKEQLVYSKEDQSVVVSKIDPDDELAWMKGLLIMKDASVDKILLAMERRYGVYFQYNTSRMSKDKYNITFRGETNLEDALSILNHLVGPMSYKINNNICELTFY